MKYFQALITMSVFSVSCADGQVHSDNAGDRQIIPTFDSVIEKDSVLQLIPLSEVIVTATRTDESLGKTTASISILNKDDLQKENSFSLADYMNKLPGLHIQQGTYNTNRITIRGIGSRTPYVSNRIRAFFGEIPITSGDGTTTIEDLELSSISRIEIIKGTASALYGSGLGGAIRFIPMESAWKQYNLNVRSETGSFGMFRAGLYGSFKSENNLLTAGLFQSQSNGYRKNNKYERTSFYVAGKYLRHSLSFSYILNFADLFAQIPSSIDKVTFESDPKAAAPNWLLVKGHEDYRKAFGGITFSYAFNHLIKNSLSLYSGLTDQYEVRPFNILNDGSLSYGLKENLSIRTNKLKFDIGFEWYHEKYEWKIFEVVQYYKGRLLNHENQLRRFINIFTGAQYQISNSLRLSGSMNLNKLVYNLRDKFLQDSVNHSGKYSYQAILSPQIGINYEITSSINLYSSIGHGFSTPTVEETLTSLGTLNRNLKPETGWGADIGSRVRFLKNRIFVDVTFYNIWLRDLLVTRRLSEEIFYGENAGKTVLQGFEFYGKMNIPSLNISDLSVTYSTSNNVFKRFVQDVTNYSGKRLPGIPDQVFSADITYNHKSGIQLYLDFKYAGDEYLNDNNSESKSAWKTFNLKIQFKTKIQKYLTVKIFGGIKNIFDKKYASMILINAPSFNNSSPRYYYPAMPRNYYIGLNIMFEK